MSIRDLTPFRTDDAGRNGCGPPDCPTAAVIKRSKQRWLWTGRIGLPSTCLLAGRSGTGKSTLAATIAAHVTGGPLLGCHEGPRIKGSVLWLPAEENVAAQTKTRLAAASAKLNRVYFPGLDKQGFTKHCFEFPADLGRIEEIARATKAVMCVVDPIASYVSGLDLNSQQHVRQLFGALRLVSERTGMTWLLIVHPSKVRSGPVIDRIFGSAAFVHCARSTLMVGGHPDGSKLRVIVHGNTNEGTLMPSVGFHLGISDKHAAPYIEWRGINDVTMEMLGVEGLDAGELDQHADARELLTRLLEADWRPAKEVMAEALAAGIGERTLRTVKAELRIPSRRVADGYGQPHWEWGPPAGIKRIQKQ